MNQAMNQANYATSQQEQDVQHGLTELVVTHEQDNYLQWLLPMVAHFSQQHSDRWLTWVGAEDISKETLLRYGIDVSRLRIIRLRDKSDTLWATWEALAAGNSHMVISSPGVLGRHEYQQLKQASEIGNCQGLMLRMR
ncbi:SulA-like leucine-rich domain-containing protein [Pseudoteredinibacter isoporae]|uniref:Cell division inhibitor SulA n=1 Tax=Pseudoteredinibacter isoporae TaxID=570281 RepID=A0A7X0JUI8_9GAMM|nr:SulA-like leucine-rich domain-containing protein [Pseudoteredinibacter isoporae]MBB6521571.1 cell division inhibitor SulA [Pseudoteredinibacter isoporae]